MPPKIGVKTWNLKKFKMLNHFEVVEIFGGDLLIVKDISGLKKIKRLLVGKKILLHSKEMQFSKKGGKENSLLLNILKKEILICKKLNIKYLIVHLRSTALIREEIKMFNKVLKFAGDRGITIIYEMNNRIFCLENIERNIKLFPKMMFNLDIGHLNLYRKKYSDKKILLFLDKIKDKIKILHIHNNFGEKDEHNSVENGTLNWKSVLNRISLENKVIIIECKKKEDILETKNQLTKYIKTQYLKTIKT